MTSYLKHLIFFFCVLIMSANLKAQDDVVDSLDRELRLHLLDDTIRLNLLNEVILATYSFDLHKADSLIVEAENLSKNLNFPKGEGDVALSKAWVSWEKGNYQESIEYGNQASDIYELCNDEGALASALIAISFAYMSSGDDTLSIENMLQAIGIYEQNHKQKDLAASFLNLGYIYTQQQELDKGIVAYEKSANLFLELNELESLAKAYLKIAHAYDAYGDFPQTIEFGNKALNLYDKLGKADQFENPYLYIGVSYYKLGKNRKAMRYFHEALSVSKKNQNQLAIAQSTYGLGFAYEEIDLNEKSIRLFKEALTINEELNEPVRIARCANGLSRTYMEIEEYDSAYKYYRYSLNIYLDEGNEMGVRAARFGMARYYLAVKDYKLAEKYALECQKFDENSGYLLHQKESHQLLSMIYSEAGEYKKAFESLEQFKFFNDSVFNQENIEKIAKLESEYKYRQELEDASNRELNLTKTVKLKSQDVIKYQRNTLIAIVGILILSIISGSIIFYLKLEQVKAENRHVTNQQKLLRLQMTPHFIFNSLAILQGLILNMEYKKSLSYLSQFSKLLRITLENSRHKTVSLSSELEAVNSYVSLQNLDMNPPYKYEFSIDPNIETMNINIPPMLIQPFVENIIEHAFTGQKDNKEIAIQLNFDEDALLVCTIADNGVGIDVKEKKSHKDKNSLATTITSERLQLLSTEFKVHGSIKIVNRKAFGEQGTLVTLVIPYLLN